MIELVEHDVLELGRQEVCGQHAVVRARDEAIAENRGIGDHDNLAGSPTQDRHQQIRRTARIFARARDGASQLLRFGDERTGALERY
jgi:hypothetical protein